MKRVLVLALAACGHAAAPRLLNGIDPARLEATTKYLASDELAGRAPGSPGGIAAEEYVAKQFAAIGLEPAGENGTYFQTVPMREATRDDAKTSLVIHMQGRDLTLVEGKDVVIQASPRQADIEIDAPLVFVGYGFESEVQGMSLNGAIALLYGGAPHVIDGKPVDLAEHAVRSDIKKRTLWLRDHGASAVIVVFDPARAARMSFANYIPKVSDSSMAWLEHGEVGSLPVLPTAILDESTVLRIGFTKEVWKALDRGTPITFTFGVTASLHIHSELADRTARNVVGILRGTDPNEVVVYTAHLDHLGIGPAIAGDNIYNGAIDDALGVAGVLEIARAFAALPHKPRRSILFLIVTGEEKGLLGSDYFVKHPLVPLDHIVADINIDGLNPLYEPFDIVALGAEHSTLGHHAEVAAHASGLVISPDPDPDQVYFIRSDQYSFVQAGIPSAFPNAGWRDAHGDTKTNKALSDAWGRDHYHQPSDQWRPEYSAAWAAKECSFDFLFGLSVANAAERPTWNPGDAFAHLQ